MNTRRQTQTVMKETVRQGSKVEHSKAKSDRAHTTKRAPAHRGTDSSSKHKRHATASVCDGQGTLENATANDRGACATFRKTCSCGHLAELRTKRASKNLPFRQHDDKGTCASSSKHDAPTRLHVQLSPSKTSHLRNLLHPSTPCNVAINTHILGHTKWRLPVVGYHGRSGTQGREEAFSLRRCTAARTVRSAPHFPRAGWRRHSLESRGDGSRNPNLPMQAGKCVRVYFPVSEGGREVLRRSFRDSAEAGARARRHKVR